MHELNKFYEWVEKTENYDSYSSNSLRYHCEKIISWANKVKKINNSLYSSKVQSIEYDIINNSVPNIYEEYLKYLDDASKHGDYTKVKQKKLMRFIYHFTKYLIPILDHIGEIKLMHDAVNNFIDDFSHNILYDLKNFDEYEIDALVKFLIKGEKLGYNLAEIRHVVEREIIERKSELIASKDLDGESEEVDFKRQFPDLKSLAKLIASFASTNGGRIYVGVKDDSNVVGMDLSNNLYDRYQRDITNITTNKILPSIKIKMMMFNIGDKEIMQINVPKGKEPIYYVNNVPYIRILTTSRPARPNEVKRKYLDYFINSISSQFE